MITQAFKALLNRRRTVTVFRHIESFVDGEYTESFSATGSVEMAVVPITANEIKYMPDGAYDMQDKKFYEVGSGTVPHKSVIQITANDRYRVNQINNRYLDGGFTVYYGKKI